jgi:signal peptidase I
VGSFLLTAYVVVLLALAVATGLKGKWGTLLLGVFLFPAWLVGAIRLAKPNSLWARRLYDEPKRERAKARAENPGRARIILPTAAVLGAAVLVAFLAGLKAYSIPSAAMEPTLRCAAPAPGCSAAESDRVAAVRFLPWINPGRGDLIAFEAPARSLERCGASGTFVKRIVGLPGDRIESRQGVVVVNGEEFEESYIEAERRGGADFPPTVVPKGHYFMLGDNRAQSCDSREYGPVSEDNLIARVLVIYWPFSRFGTP